VCIYVCVYIYVCVICFILKVQDHSKRTSGYFTDKESRFPKLVFRRQFRVHQRLCVLISSSAHDDRRGIHEGRCCVDYHSLWDRRTGVESFTGTFYINSGREG